MEPLVNISKEEFNSLMKDKGLDGTAEYVVERAKQNVNPNAPNFSFETLRDGTSPLIDFMSGDSNLDLEKRKLNSEQIITLFSNVEDYGKYDTSLTLSEREGAETKAFYSGVGRAAPEAAAGSYGFIKGARLAAPIANLIPPLGPFGIAAKGGVYLLGGLAGSIASAFVADTAEKVVIGDEDPVLPSLESSKRMGEGLTYGVSMLATPWLAAPKAVNKSATGAIEFLDNFKQISTGKLAAKADEAIEITAKNAGLSTRYFEKAKAAYDKAAQQGPMFGERVIQGLNLGFTRFNPKGYMIDPTKGPLSTRVIGAAEKGIDKSFELAKQKSKRFLALETAAGVGGAGGSYLAQEYRPYSEGYRFLGETIFSGAVPFIPSLIIDKAPDVAKATIRAIKGWYGTKKNETVAGSRLEKEGAKRLYLALQRSEEYSGEAQIESLIDALMHETNFVGPKKPGQRLVVADLAESLKLPLSTTLRSISNELEKTSQELSSATSKGRENLMAGSKNALMALVADGSPEALAVAGRLEQKLFEQNIMDNLDESVGTLYNAAERVLKRDPDANVSDRVDLSEKLYEVLSQQIKIGKKRESDLWNDVRDFEITDFRSINGRKLRLPNSLRIFSIGQKEGGLKFASAGGEAQFKKALGDFREDVELMAEYFAEGSKGSSPVTVGRLWDMRSYLADESVVQRRAGNKALSNKLNKYSNAVLQDLIGSKQDPNVEYNTARAYTIARNKVFSQSFLQEAQDISKQRGLVLDPAELLDKAFRGGPLSTATNRRINEIFAAESFLLERAADRYSEPLKVSIREMDDLTTQDVVDLSIRDALSNIVVKKKIKDAFGNESEIVDINLKALERYKKSPGANKIFQKFPNLKTDLETAESARRLLANTLNNGSLLAKSAETQAFQSVIEHSEKPSLIISDAIKSADPVKVLDNYVDLINKQSDTFVDSLTGNEYTKEQALSGLRTAMMDYAVTQSGGSGTGFSINKFQDAMFGRPKGMNPTNKFNFADYMKDNGMLSDRHYNLIQENIKEMKGVEQAFMSGRLEEVLFKNPSLSKGIAVRMLGATMGQMGQERLNNLLKKVGLGTQGGGIGGGMVAAQATSAATVQMLLRGPETARANALIQIMSDPAILGPLLKDLKNKKDADSAMKALESAFTGISRQGGRRLPYATQYLLNVLQEEDYDQLEEQKKLVPDGFSASLERSPALQTVSARSPAAPTGGASAPEPRPFIVAQLPVAQQPPAQTTAGSSGVASSPEMRARYKRDYPNDIVSSLIPDEQPQGIESLLS